MTLGRKTLIVTGAAVLALLLGLLTVSSTIVMRGFRAVEAAETRDHVRQVVEALDDESQRLASTAADWAVWDDTYAFVRSRDTEYARSNLTMETLERLELDLLAIVDTEGEAVWAFGYSRREEAVASVPVELRRWLGPGSPLLDHPGPDSRPHGLIAAGDGAMVVAASPILRSSGAGPIRGTLVMGRLLTGEALDQLQRITGLDLMIHPVGAAPGTGPPDPRGRAVVVRPVDDRLIEGASILEDVAGEPTLVVRVRKARIIVAQGVASQRQLLVAILVLAGLFAAALGLVAQRTVLRRIRRIRAEVAEVGATADGSLRVEVQGRDELGDLAGGINTMLDALGRARGQRDEVAERYWAVVEQASEGILLIDPETTRILESNEAFRRLVGWDLESLFGSTLGDLFDDGEGAISVVIGRLVAGGPPEVVELLHSRADGTEVDVEMAANLVRHGGRKVVSALVRDVSERKQALEVVRRREAALEAVAFAAERLLQGGEGALPDVLARLGQAVDASRAYVFENHTDEGGVVLTSQRFEWVAPGIEAQIDNPVFQGFPLVGEGLEPLGQALTSGATVQSLVRDLPGGVGEILAKGGTRSLLVVPILVGGDWWGSIGFDDCVSEREWSSAVTDALRAAASTIGAAIQRGRTERAQAESDARYRALVEQLPAIVYTAEFGEHGVWRYVSPQIQPMLGFSPEEWTADPMMWDRHIHPGDVERVLREERHSESTGEPLNSEYRMIGRDGTIRWFRDEATVRRDEAGHPVLQGVMYDVTERRDAEDKLRRQNEYLTALHETALALMDRLDHSDLLEAVLRRAAALAGTTDGWLYLVDPDGSAMELTVGVGGLGHLVGLRIQKGEGVSGQVWATGERVVVEDYAVWSGRLSGLPDDLGGVVGVPLKSGGDVVGVIGLSHPERSKRFSPDDVDLLTGFAELASIALDNARLYEAAREEQDRVRTLSDAALEGIVIHDGGRILEVNRAFSRMFGRSPDDLVGRRLEDLVATSSRETLRERLRVPSDDPVELEARGRDGRRLTVEVQSRRMSFAGRTVLVAAVRDVSERKRAEEEVRLLHAITVAMAEAEDPDAALEVAVREVCRATGWDVGEAWVPSADGSRLECSRASYVQTEGLEAFRSHSEGLTLAPGEGLPGRVWASREPLWVEDISKDPAFRRSEPAARAGLRAAAAFPVMAGDQVVAVLSFFLEEPHGEDFRLVTTVSAVAAQLGAVVRRKRAEEALRVAEEKYRRIFEQAAEGIFRMTADGCYESVNPALAAMLGYASEEEMLARVRDVRSVHVDERRLATWRKRLGRGGTLSEFEYEARRRDGTTLWVSENARAIRDEAGGLVAIEGTLLDISQRRRAEESLRTAYESEREVAEQLRAVDEMKNAFLAAVSHELRTPLSSILGFSLTLSREDLEVPPDQVREMVGRIAANARKLERLLADLLDLDRMSRGILEPSRRVTDLRALARTVVQETEMHGRSVFLEADDLLADVDGPKIERILENLLANAAKYTTPDTRVWVRMTHDDQGVLLMVEDDGPGVPEEQRTMIFEPFRQGDGTPSHAPGTGVGLSLVTRFAELHGGRAWVEDRPGGGASFRVHLPGRIVREEDGGTVEGSAEQIEIGGGGRPR